MGLLLRLSRPAGAGHDPQPRTRADRGGSPTPPRSRIWGGEVEAVVQPMPRLRFTQAVGFKRGRYERFADIDPTTLRQDPATLLFSVGTVDRAGQPLPIANWSYHGSAAYTQPVGRFALEAAADYSYRDVLPSFLGPAFALPERWIANATLTLSPAGGGWSIGVYGRNIFDTGYDLTRNYFLPNARIASPGRPASYGVRVTASF
ncbi:MAG: TonB-dependent receptor [Sphingomonas fennica]